MIIPFKNKRPKIASSSFIADGAMVIGDVRIGKESSIWFNAVLRGDVNKIVIGNMTNIQDGSLLHVADEYPCIVGNRVTVGHGVNLHGCVIKDEALVGIGAIILNGAVVESGCIIGAGTLVPERMHIPKNSLVLGYPGKVIRQVSKDDAKKNLIWAPKYSKYKEVYKNQKL